MHGISGPQAIGRATPLPASLAYTAPQSSYASIASTLPPVQRRSLRLSSSPAILRRSPRHARTLATSLPASSSAIQRPLPSSRPLPTSLSPSRRLDIYSHTSSIRFPSLPSLQQPTLPLLQQPRHLVASTTSSRGSRNTEKRDRERSLSPTSQKQQPKRARKDTTRSSRSSSIENRPLVSIAIPPIAIEPFFPCPVPIAISPIAIEPSFPRPAPIAIPSIAIETPPSPRLRSISIAINAPIDAPIDASESIAGPIDVSIAINSNAVDSSTSPPSEPTHASIAAKLVEASPRLASLLSYSSIRVVEKPLHSRHAKLFLEASSRVISSYLATPSEENLYNFLILPKVLSIGLKNIEGRSLGDTLRAFPSIIPTAPARNNTLVIDYVDDSISLEEEEDKALALAVLRASDLLDNGLIGRASRAIVSPATIAKPTRETYKALEEKHPIDSIPRFSNRISPPITRPIVEKDILDAFSTFSKDTSSGLDGWTIPLLKLVLEKGKGIAFFLTLSNLANKGLAKGKNLLLASRLIPLAKEKEKGVRPIAVGSLIYRLFTKAILGTFSTKIEDALLPSQLGVGSRLGVEPIIALLSSTLDKKNGSSYSSITGLDIKNAFNSIGQLLLASSIARYAPSLYKLARWAYNNPSILATRLGLLVSTTGVRQGDPLGPLLFSLAIRPFLEDLTRKLREIDPDASIIAYIDDIYILSSRNSDRVLDIAEETLREYGLVLNRQKSFTTSISAIRTSPNGLQVLGTIIGSIEARRKFLTAKIATFQSILDRLRKLSKQKGLLLLRGSIHLLLRHLVRTIDPRGIEDLLDQIDTLIYNYIRYLRGLEGERDLDRDLIALPTRNGGLGIPLFLESALEIYTTCNRLSRTFLIERGYKISPIAPIVSIEPIDEYIDIDNIDIQPPDPPDPVPSLRKIVASYTTRRLGRLASTTSLYEKRALLENSSYLGRKWLDILPLSKNHTIADIELEAALRTRFLVSTLTRASSPTSDSPRSSLDIDTWCRSCNTTPITMLNHNDTCKGAARRWIARHNAIRNAIASSLASSSESITTSIEPAIDGIATRPDLVITTSSTRIYYDVQIVAINADSAEVDPYSTLDEAANAKSVKYARLGPSFRPLIFSAGGLLSKDTSLEYKRLQKLLSPSAANYLDSTISLVLLRARALARNSLEI